jgi:hypothetical protein
MATDQGNAHDEFNHGVILIEQSRPEADLYEAMKNCFPCHRQNTFA